MNRNFFIKTEFNEDTVIRLLPPKEMVDHPITFPKPNHNIECPLCKYNVRLIKYVIIPLKNEFGIVDKWIQIKENFKLHELFKKFGVK